MTNVEEQLIVQEHLNEIAEMIESGYTSGLTRDGKVSWEFTTNVVEE